MGFLDYEGLSKFLDKVKILLSGKQNVLHFGDGLTVETDEVSVTTPVKNLTQVEYDALSDEEKNSGLYIVTDANIGLNDRGDVYSTEETRIGTWIDGKPLYRKVYKTSVKVPSSSIVTLVSSSIISALNVETVIRVDGEGSFDSGEDYRSLNSFTSVVKFVPSDESIQMYSRDGTYDVQFVYIEYTKTTDPTPTSKTTVLTSQVPLPNKVTLNTSTSPVTVTFPSTAVTASASASSAQFTFSPVSATASASSPSFTL